MPGGGATFKVSVASVVKWSQRHWASFMGEPLTAKELLRLAGIVPGGAVHWDDLLLVQEKGPGVYIVEVIDPAHAPDDLSKSERARWVDGQQIVYIGRASPRQRRGLRFRLREFSKRGRKHSGGKTIFALRGGMVVTWARIDDYALAEVRLLEIFEDAAGQLPFGNLKAPLGMRKRGAHSRPRHRPRIPI
jgi:hypothetical protein